MHAQPTVPGQRLRYCPALSAEISSSPKPQATAKQSSNMNPPVTAPKTIKKSLNSYTLNYNQNHSLQYPLLLVKIKNPRLKSNRSPSLICKNHLPSLHKQHLLLPHLNPDNPQKIFLTVCQIIC